VRTNGASSKAHDQTLAGEPLHLNTLTVFNVALLRNPAIMASSLEEAVRKLRWDPQAVKQFRNAYGREPDVATLLDAIATYERSLRV
jgi:cytochrome c peroxidase